MSEALPRPLAEALAESDRQANFEQRIFIASPVGTLATATLIFAAFFGAYILIALATHVPLTLTDAKGLYIPSDTRGAFVLSLLIATALGIQRYARVKDRAEISAFPPLLRHGIMSAQQFAMWAPRAARLRGATLIAIPIGLFASFFAGPHAPFGISGAVAIKPTFVWFSVATTFLTVLFVRGVELTRAGSVGTRRFIDDELVIDLLRVDRLSVVGHSASRAALIWFSVSAVTCLFFVGGSLPVAAILVLLGGCAGMGMWIFVRTMEYVHHKIHEAKTSELDRVRAQIASVRDEAHANSDAAHRLQGLLAYEQRIAAVHEWPFDQTTLVRLGASALILTVPWFGQALAGIVADRIGQWVR